MSAEDVAVEVEVAVDVGVEVDCETTTAVEAIVARGKPAKETAGSGFISSCSNFRCDSDNEPLLLLPPVPVLVLVLVLRE